MQIDSGNFSWGTEVVTRKTRILGVAYNATSNEFIRTATLVKNTIVQIDATPFRQFYEQHYGVTVGKKTKKDEKTEKKVSEKKQAIYKKRQEGHSLEPAVAEQMSSGRLLAVITTRPGQIGRADGYILEGRELDFYSKKLPKKKGDKKEGQ